MPIWSAYRKKAANFIRTFEDIEDKKLWRGCGKVNLRTNGGRSGDDGGGFHCNFCYFLPLTTNLMYFTCWCEKYTTFPFLLAHTHNSESIKNFFFFKTALIHLQRHFSIRRSFSSNNWAQLTVKISALRVEKKKIFFIKKFSKAKSLFLLLSLWVQKLSLIELAQCSYNVLTLYEIWEREKMRLRLIMERKKYFIWWTIQIPVQWSCSSLFQCY